MQSVFTDKEIRPDDVLLKKALGKTFKLWKELHAYATETVANAREEWSFSAKFGWSLRISDKKRVVLYLLPRDGFFKTALVFGAKASEAVMQSNVAEHIKTELQNAKPYAEGRGIRIDISNEEAVPDIKTLIAIKIAY